MKINRPNTTGSAVASSMMLVGVFSVAALFGWDSYRRSASYYETTYSRVSGIVPQIPVALSPRLVSPVLVACMIAATVSFLRLTSAKQRFSWSAVFVALLSASWLAYTLLFDNWIAFVSFPA